MKKILILGSDKNGKLITHNYRSKKPTPAENEQSSENIPGFKGKVNNRFLSDTSKKG